ncbi:MAG: hypothetical protein ACTTKL_02005 [Treponema sp.]
MKQSKTVLFIGAAIAMVTIAGCSSTKMEELGRFSIISSKNIDLSRLGELKRSQEKVATKKFNARGIFIRDVTLSENYQLENALDSALEKIPGAVALVDAKIEYFMYSGIGRQKWGYKFEGTALIDPDMAPADTARLEDGTIYFLSTEDNKVAFISEEEYNKFLK